jgi:hypothetical protein
VTPLQARLDELDALRSAVLAEVRGLPPQAVVFRTRPEAWSPVQVLHHLCVVEEYALLVFSRPIPDGLRRRSLKEWVGAATVRIIFGLGLRVRMPTQRVAPDAAPVLDQVVGRWEQAGREVRKAILQREGSPGPMMRHPVAGPLDPLQTAGFLLDHLRHHRRQLQRIRNSPGFPYAGSGLTP